MQTPLALGAALLAVLILLISRRRPALTPTPSSPAAAGPAAVAARAARDEPALPRGAQQSPGARLAQPMLMTPRQRGQRLLRLHQAMKAGPQGRLAAMQELAAQPDRRALPLIRQGLRDCDPVVVHAAACAIGQFRQEGPAPQGAGGSSPSAAARGRLPRNAAPRG